MLIWDLMYVGTVRLFGVRYFCFPSLIFGLQFSGGRTRTADYLGSLKTLVWLSGGLRKLF